MSLDEYLATAPPHEPPVVAVDDQVRGWLTEAYLAAPD